MSFLWGHWYPCFGLLVTSALGFKSQGGLACMLSCLRAIPQIHLWCDTCWPLDGQHGSQATLTHVLAAVRHIHKHWWRWGRSRSSNLWPGSYGKLSCFKYPRVQGLCWPLYRHCSTTPSPVQPPSAQAHCKAPEKCTPHGVLLVITVNDNCRAHKGDDSGSAYLQAFAAYLDRHYMNHDLDTIYSMVNRYMASVEHVSHISLV